MINLGSIIGKEAPPNYLLRPQVEDLFGFINSERRNLRFGVTEFLNNEFLVNTPWGKTFTPTKVGTRFLHTQGCDERGQLPPIYQGFYDRIVRLCSEPAEEIRRALPFVAEKTAALWLEDRGHGRALTNYKFYYGPADRKPIGQDYRDHNGRQRRHEEVDVIANHPPAGIAAMLAECKSSSEDFRESASHICAWYCYLADELESHSSGPIQLGMIVPADRSQQLRRYLATAKNTRPLTQIILSEG